MNYEKITKTQARKMHTEGKDVYILPNNMRVDNWWMTPCLLHPTDDFDKFCGEYQFYNCNAETGRRIAFYKEVI